MTSNTDRATIFAKWPDGRDCYFPFIRGWHGPTDQGESLAERIEYVRNYGCGYTPVAWCTEADSPDMLSWEGMRAESIAAGRTIEYDIRCHKFIPLGLNEAKQETPEDKTTIRFYNDMSDELGLPRAATEEGWARVGRKLTPTKLHRFYELGLAFYGIESTYVDKSVEPAQSRTPTLDKLEQQKEKQRPRLTWADSKAVDRFADFTVTSGSSNPDPAPRLPEQASPDLSPTGHLVKADHALAAVRQLVR